MNTNIEILLQDIQNVINDSKSTMRSQSMSFSEEALNSIDELPIHLDLFNDELLESDNRHMYNNLTSNVEIDTLKDRLISLSIDLPMNGESIGTGLSPFHEIKNLTASLMNLRVNLKVILAKLEKNDKTFIKDEKNDKQGIIEYLERAMLSFEQEAINITPQEKEKVIVYFKETIKEVQKPKTAWEKVLGCLNVLAIAATLYTSTPTIKNDIVNAAKNITKEVETEVTPTSMPEGFFLENQEVEILVDSSSTV